MTKNYPTFTENFLMRKNCIGLLQDLTFSVKDVFDVKGYSSKFGNMLWDSQQQISSTHSNCVNSLLDAGAVCLGKTALGEFCGGIEGKNPEYGMPINPANKKLVPGGSSSGSAVSVGSFLVDFSLGTDSGGSVRIPASYCGIFGYRPTHGIINMHGCLSLSESTDTIGVFSRSAEILDIVAQILIKNKQKKPPENFKKIILMEDLLLQCNSKIKNAAISFCEKFSNFHSLERVYINSGTLDENDMSMSDTLRYLICGETWQKLGDWVKENQVQYGKNTSVNFPAMESINKKALQSAKLKQEYYTEKIGAMINDSLLCIPTNPLPPRTRSEALRTIKNDFNYKNIRDFISLSSVCKIPQITIPIHHEPYPIGISLLGPRNNDLSLIRMVKSFFNHTQKIKGL